MDLEQLIVKIKMEARVEYSRFFNLGVFVIEPQKLYQ